MDSQAHAFAGFVLFALRNLMTRPIRTGLALVGLSIPVLGVLGLCSLSAGMRVLLEDTLAQVQGIIVLRENGRPATCSATCRRRWKGRCGRSKACVRSRLRSGRLPLPSKGKGCCPGHRGVLSEPGNGPLKRLLNLVQIEGQDVCEHARLQSEVYRRRLLPAEQGGGRFLNESDRGGRIWS